MMIINTIYRFTLKTHKLKGDQKMTHSNLIIRIEKGLKKDFKVRAAKNYENMSRLIAQFIRNYVEQENRKEHDQNEHNIIFGD